jgi:AraC family transcriptional regulator
MSDGNLIGAVRAKRNVGGLRLFETEYAADLTIDPHPHAEPLLSVVLEGGLTERWGRTRADCEAGALTYLPSHEPHSQEYHVDGSRCFLVQFGQPWIKRMTALGLESCSDPLALKGSRANWLADQLYREFRTPDEASDLAVEGLALAMLGELVRADSTREQESHPGWLVRALEMLHGGVGGQVAMADIAAEVDVHPTHLARTFRERFGCTMGEYLRRLRVDAARDEMLTTDQPLATIALSAGFADQAHFTRTFKQETGETPGAWRKARAKR